MRPAGPGAAGGRAEAGIRRHPAVYGQREISPRAGHLLAVQRRKKHCRTHRVHCPLSEVSQGHGAGFGVYGRGAAWCVPVRDLRAGPWGRRRGQQRQPGLCPGHGVGKACPLHHGGGRAGHLCQRYYVRKRRLSGRRLTAVGAGGAGAGDARQRPKGKLGLLSFAARPGALRPERLLGV
ncbi:hypothetical protein SDC9_94718 [bioreactor metagenome]|uniref:Uncharacterized protein n=1 Tax=bioreactor metagenome TaxID=1076179 RepID=A0A645A4K0_9ZZZZ